MSVAGLHKKILQAALFYEIWDAMKVTFKHMFHRPITFQYPRETADHSRHVIAAPSDCCATMTAWSDAWVVTSVRRPVLRIASKW